MDAERAPGAGDAAGGEPCVPGTHAAVPTDRPGRFEALPSASQAPPPADSEPPATIAPPVAHKGAENDLVYAHSIMPGGNDLIAKPDARIPPGRATALNRAWTGTLHRARKPRTGPN
ncbi:hypothetical protein GCM10010278_05050 [Streptomyces melanogenes]|nr:hypothetical protein GCM10010278_05050 [Streptomyces melanogenes]